ncbi:CLUMA_CG002412, isoform A [Clunio marinus]|uniref:CLUMA_CG002412, isoform A n=1 Tax=Clunio marinus TaxID=568069 RepID=A0A1J1HMJ7_9DIPT|nr:CLUMA_CG002412, isoform A [Clunio marinus]
MWHYFCLKPFQTTVEKTNYQDNGKYCLIKNSIVFCGLNYCRAFCKRLNDFFFPQQLKAVIKLTKFILLRDKWLISINYRTHVSQASYHAVLCKYHRDMIWEKIICEDEKLSQRYETMAQKKCNESFRRRKQEKAGVVI